MLLITVIALFLLQMTDGKNDDVKSGLNCILLSDESKTQVCTGTNKNYAGEREVAKNDKKAESLDIQTRFFRPPCRGASQCTAFQSTYAPTLLQNKYGQDRYIYQDEDYGFTQTVRVVTCGAGPCGHKGQCKQMYRDYELIAWDPYANNCNPVIEKFSIPDCCGCSEPHYWN